MGLTRENPELDPPSCTTPRQLTKYITAYNVLEADLNQSYMSFQRTKTHRRPNNNNSNNNHNNNNIHVIVKSRNKVSDGVGLCPTITPTKENIDNHLRRPKDRMFDTEKGRPKQGSEEKKHLKRGTSWNLGHCYLISPRVIIRVKHTNLFPETV